ncbi:MAG TPA: HlyD family efflux transporter periplasmic adaptor subunit [Pyrinomonadaceae bacterium]|nr:HlyD family efflux transporter periplasmic adaptor subunit [Pyrinomonadaceae bacterium]
MDIPRQNKAKRKRQIRNALLGVVAVAAIGAITVGLTRMKPAAPSVERSTQLIDTVKRGEMLRQVHGNGTLVPQKVRWIPAPAEGRVENVFVQPGVEVTPDTVIAEMVNPQLEQEAQDAEYQVKAIEADLDNLRVKLESDRMTQQSATASVQSDYSQAKLQLDTDEQLARDGLIPPLTLRLSRVRVQELQNRLKIEQDRLGINAKAITAQIAAQQARVEQLRALARLRHSQVSSLKVLAGTAGVLQEVSVQAGQQLQAGANIARVADPTSLKAELRVAETQAKDIAIGQHAEIDTRNGVVPGHVWRVDPSAQQGTVGVDVLFDAPLPQGARPDLSVDGTIELERLANVLYVGRPAFGQGQSTVGMFRLEPDGQTAVRVPVQLGRSSVNTVEVVEGLREGDQVILSDTSQWDKYDRIRLN